MNKQEKEAIHQKYCEKIHSLYINKNSDYGDSVHETFEKFGMDAFSVRLYDKLNRIYSLTRPDVAMKITDERIEDTLLDLANYALIALVELEEEKDKYIINYVEVKHE